MRRRMLFTGLATLALSALALVGTAWADSPTGAEIAQAGQTVEHTAASLNMLWVVIGAVLVIFMQAGFALVETGFCRAKHAAHVVLTNFAIFGLGFVGFYLVGYALAFGAVSVPLLGIDNPLGSMIGIGDSGHWGLFGHSGFGLSGAAYGVGTMAFFLYMVAFMDTTATIPTGAMAERWSFKNFTIWGLFCGAIYYPLYAGWVWGGGWLSQLGNSLNLGHGVVDFAGSGVVHAMGGAAALAGAIVIGPRIGKYVNGKAVTIAGHHIPMAMLGTFILLFGWFGFNAASTLSATDLRFSVVATNTAIAGAFGATFGMFWVWKRSGKPDPGMCANGMLAGLVAITAPCAFVQPWAAALIGTVAAVIVIEAIWVIERKLKVDDPVGAIGVHGIGGTLGVLFVGLFADGNYGDGLNGIAGGVKGLFYGDASQLGAQVISVAVIWTFGFGLAYAFFKISNKFTPIRSSEADELAGVDVEVGVRAYPEFMPEPVSVGNGSARITLEGEKSPVL